MRALWIHPELNQNTAIQFLDYVLQRLPFQVEVIQTDNGDEFQSAFRWHGLSSGGRMPFAGHVPSPRPAVGTRLEGCAKGGQG